MKTVVLGVIAICMLIMICGVIYADNSTTNITCTPQCADKNCGSDGCNGYCGNLNGNCLSGSYCNSAGLCMVNTSNYNFTCPAGYECGRR